MSDVLPKMRLFLFLAFISLLLNLAIVGVSLLANQTADIETVIVPKLAFASTSAFVPFVSLVNIVTLNLTDIPLLLVFYSIVTIIIDGVKIFILAMIVLQIISNLLWSPDV